MKKAFTLTEVMVAVGLLSLMLAFSSVIFKVSIGSHRTAGANAEIMQKLRAITDQLNTDFKGLQKDGYLILRSEVISRREYEGLISPFNPVGVFRADRLYYFTTGDFQSWSDPTVRSNIARIYFGHDRISLDPSLLPDLPVSEWRLAHYVLLLAPGMPPPALPPPLPAVVDYIGVSYAQCKDNLISLEDAGALLTNPIQIDTFSNSPVNLQCLMAQNVGGIVIEWTDGTRYPPPDNSLAWFGVSILGEVLTKTGGDSDIPPDPNPAYGGIEGGAGIYSASWTPTPDVPERLWPRALKFTFTLYDSNRVIRDGRTFTHIVYIGD